MAEPTPRKEFVASVLLQDKQDVSVEDRALFTEHLAQFAKQQLNGKGILEFEELPAGDSGVFIKISAPACKQKELRELLSDFFSQQGNAEKFPNFSKVFVRQQQAISGRCCGKGSQ
jgi:hypothetical protein